MSDSLGLIEWKRTFGTIMTFILKSSWIIFFYLMFASVVDIMIRFETEIKDQVPAHVRNLLFKFE